jgi:hypothetical protein
MWLGGDAGQIGPDAFFASGIRTTWKITFYLCMERFIIIRTTYIANTRH